MSCMDDWPVVKGDYQVGNDKSRICVVTLASHFELAPEYMKKVALVGPCHTENLGIEKIIANVVANPNIRFILVCGEESRGHMSGNTLKAIHTNGIDDNGRIIGSEGAIPFIENIPEEAVKRFQAQVQLIERIGETDMKDILRIIEECHNKGDAFSEHPLIIQAMKKRRKREKFETKGAGDIVISKDVSLDISSGIIA